MGCSFIADIVACLGVNPQCREINSGQKRAPPPHGGPHGGEYRAQTGENHKGSVQNSSNCDVASMLAARSFEFSIKTSRKITGKMTSVANEGDMSAMAAFLRSKFIWERTHESWIYWFG
jgi:hypothetical protein